MEEAFLRAASKEGDRAQNMRAYRWYLTQCAVQFICHHHGDFSVTFASSIIERASSGFDCVCSCVDGEYKLGAAGNKTVLLMICRSWQSADNFHIPCV